MIGSAINHWSILHVTLHIVFPHIWAIHATKTQTITELRSKIFIYLALCFTKNNSYVRLINSLTMLRHNLCCLHECHIQVKYVQNRITIYLVTHKCPSKISYKTLIQNIGKEWLIIWFQKKSKSLPNDLNKKTGWW